MAQVTKPPISSTEYLRSLKEHLQRTLQIPALKPPQWDRSFQAGQMEFLPPPLNLPLNEEEDIFCNFPFPSQTLDGLKKTYRHHLERIRQLHLQRYAQASRDIYSLPHTSRTRPLNEVLEDLRKVYQMSYSTRYLPLLQGEILAIRAKHTPPSELKSVPLFKAEYTPLLEKYFQSNAYPSAPDRQMLARKTSMTPRQIEVWFQNHRKRAKESGKEIRRLPPNSALSSALLELGNQSDVQVTTDDEDSSEPNKYVVSDTDDNPISGGSFSSACAFPRPYSHSSVSSFRGNPEGASFKFPSPQWPRQKSTKPIHQHDVDVDALTVMFASKLNIRATGLEKKRRTHLCRNGNPWYSATTTKPYPAPHPALMPTPRSCSVQSIKHNMSSLSPTRRERPSTNTQARSHRKAAPFPRRYPSKLYSLAKYHPYATTSVSKGPNPFSSRFLTSPTWLKDSSAHKATLGAPTVSWVKMLESVPTGESNPANVDFVVDAPSSLEPTSLHGRIASTNSDSSFGSRSSSLSSVESFSPLPDSQQHSDNSLVFDHHDLFSADFTEFDRILNQDTQITFNDDLFLQKYDETFSSTTPYMHSPHSFPMASFVPALS